MRAVSGQYTAQWWKRTDLSATFNELVTASMLDATIARTEGLVFDGGGQRADVTTT